MAAVYDRAWRRVRQFVLERDGYSCYECGAWATTVDHKIPVLEWPAGRLDPENCRASCDVHNYGRAAKRTAAIVRLSARRGSVRAL